jgi:UDP-N-acetylmuramyl tripeptide synthase
MGIIHASFYKFTLNQKIDKDVDSGDFNIMLVSDFDVIIDRKEAIAKALKIAKAGEVILIAGNFSFVDS